MLIVFTLIAYFEHYNIHISIPL